MLQRSFNCSREKEKGKECLIQKIYQIMKKEVITDTLEKMTWFTFLVGSIGTLESQIEKD